MLPSKNDIIIARAPAPPISQPTFVLQPTPLQAAPSSMLPTTPATHATTMTPVNLADHQFGQTTPTNQSPAHFQNLNEAKNRPFNHCNSLPNRSLHCSNHNNKNSSQQQLTSWRASLTKCSSNKQIKTPLLPLLSQDSLLPNPSKLQHSPSLSGPVKERTSHSSLTVSQTTNEINSLIWCSTGHASTPPQHLKASNSVPALGCLQTLRTKTLFFSGLAFVAHFFALKNAKKGPCRHWSYNFYVSAGFDRILIMAMTSMMFGDLCIWSIGHFRLAGRVWSKSNTFFGHVGNNMKKICRLQDLIEIGINTKCTFCSIFSEQ